MDIVFDIVDNIPEPILIITITFAEKYNVSISKDSDSVTIYFYDINRRDIIKCINPYRNKTKSLKRFKDFVIQEIGDTPFEYLHGISTEGNKNYLSKHFHIDINDMNIIHFSKEFT